MDIAIEILIALFGVAGYGYLGGREKEKRDVLTLLAQYPSMSASQIAPLVEEHIHRKLGKRGHYDDRRRRDPETSMGIGELEK